MKGMAVMIFGSDFEKNFLTPKVQRVLLNLGIQEKTIIKNYLEEYFGIDIVSKVINHKF